MICYNQVLIVPMVLAYVDLPVSENEDDCLCSLSSGT